MVLVAIHLTLLGEHLLGLLGERTGSGPLERLDLPVSGVASEMTGGIARQLSIKRWVRHLDADRTRQKRPQATAVRQRTVKMAVPSAR